MLRTDYRISAFCACLGLLALVAGCTGKQVATSMEDQAFVASLTESQNSKEDMAFGSPDAMKEVRVADMAGSMVLPSGASAADAAAADAASSARSARLAALAASMADVYFDYNRSSIRKEGRAKLDANARLLMAEQDWKLLITGHCDQRGSQAYNLVLGERRAQSVKRYLSDLGLPSSRMQVASYGKEKPFCTEQNEDCWQQNRRAHFAMQ